MIDLGKTRLTWQAGNSCEAGFTLIELSIVLVIIGLIVGGILAGQALINAAAIRAQVSQNEKYQTAVATFLGKYAALPGDLTPAVATQFGFVSRAGSAGRGDGNGELDGYIGQAWAWAESGETLLFWEDLSTAHLIDGSFTAYVDGTSPTCTLGTSCAQYFPTAKIGNGNVIYVYSGYANSCCPTDTDIGPNFLGLSVTEIGTNSNVGTNAAGSSTPGLTVAQAYAIDSKIDDGKPKTGRVLAQYLDNPLGEPGWSTNSTTPSATTCYDTSSGTAAYSIAQNNGAGVNCGLSFQFQAGTQ